MRDEQRQPKVQPSAEIVRVECAKCRRECDLSGARATLCGDRACRMREMQARVRFVRCARNPLRRSCVSSARNAGESAIRRLRAQPSAEIVRVECAKCRRECDLPAARATLCGDRACRVREMQARVRFAGCARDPLRRSGVSSARNAGESAICRVCAQPSAEIVRVECAKCRRECDLPAARATLCGDRACRVREMQARVRFAGCPRNPLRRSCVSSARNGPRPDWLPRPDWQVCSAATTTRLAGLFKWTPRSASHWRTCHQMTPSTPPSWLRWSPPCLRSGQRSESLPDAGCHLDVHMVTACLIPRLLPYKSCVDVVLRKHDKYRHSVGESLPYTRASRELNDQSIRKHAQCLLCVTSCYFVACFCGRGDWKMSSIVVLNYI